MSRTSPVSASALADRIEKASVVSLMEQYERPGPIWAMPLSDEQAALIVSALRGLAQCSREQAIEECARVAENHTTNLDGSEAAFVYRTARKIAHNIRALSDTSTDRGGK
jgi:hypothetical protein